MNRVRALSVMALMPGLAFFSASHGQPAGALGEDFIFRVRSGDTLINLANTYTRKASNWIALQTLNKIETPEQLPIGLNLRIPLAMIPEQAAAARVVHVSGQAQLDGQALKPGTSVSEGSTIATSANGFVTVELADGSKLTLPAGGSVQMTRLRQFEGTALTDSIIHVDQGSVESSVAPKGEGVGRFEVRTPVAVTGVRGTKFRVQSGAKGAYSEVLEGSVRLQTHAPGVKPNGPVPVAKGYGAAIAADGSVSGVKMLLPAPELGEPTRVSGSTWTSAFTAVPQAHSYLVRVSRDEEGANLVSSAKFDTTAIRFSAPGPGTFYVRVRSIDDLGLSGDDAMQVFTGANQLMTSFGLGVSSGTDGIISLTDY